MSMASENLSPAFPRAWCAESPCPRRAVFVSPAADLTVHFTPMCGCQSTCHSHDAIHQASIRSLLWAPCTKYAVLGVLWDMYR